jgi:hypothetical protein
MPSEYARVWGIEDCESRDLLRMAGCHHPSQQAAPIVPDQGTVTPHMIDQREDVIHQVIDRVVGDRQGLV